jgi:hypothetical protein
MMRPWLLSLLFFCGMGLSAAFADEPIVATEEENALIPKFLAPVKWGVKRGEIHTFRPEVNIDEAPLAGLSDRSELVNNYSVNYICNGGPKDLDEPLRQINLMALEGFDIEPTAIGTQGYQLLKSALGKYGTPSQIKIAPWRDDDQGLLPNATLGTFIWTRGNFTADLSIIKNKDGKLIAQYAVLFLYQGPPKTSDAPNTTVDTKDAFLSPEVKADLEAYTGPTWE